MFRRWSTSRAQRSPPGVVSTRHYYLELGLVGVLSSAMVTFLGISMVLRVRQLTCYAKQAPDLRPALDKRGRNLCDSTALIATILLGDVSSWRDSFWRHFLLARIPHGYGPLSKREGLLGSTGSCRLTDLFFHCHIRSKRRSWRKADEDLQQMPGAIFLDIHLLTNAGM